MVSTFIKIESLDKVTHDTIVTNKPSGYTSRPEQTPELTMKKQPWEEGKRPFPFTCLPQKDYLKFTIKIIPSQLVSSHSWIWFPNN